MSPMAPYILTAALAATPQPAQELPNEQPRVTVVGDVALKHESVLEEHIGGGGDAQGRYRLNLANVLHQNGGTKIVAATRHDAPLGDPEHGYGIDALRMGSAKVQVGVSSLKGPRGRGTYGHMFFKPTGNTFFAANIPPAGLDGAVVLGEGTYEVGGVELRGFFLDNIGVPRIQKLELEVASPELDRLGGARIFAQYNRTGTPGGYVDSIEVGLRKGIAARAGTMRQGHYAHRGQR